eukprot:scaffold61771_cov40-Prasinocladus_malaysianus.AAC.3
MVPAEAPVRGQPSGPRRPDHSRGGDGAHPPPESRQAGGGGRPPGRDGAGGGLAGGAGGPGHRQRRGRLWQ